ncbi:MAG: hypothetical protein LBB12_04495 [Holosporaceae bacterium]|jgi:hypothetical protein|nr:hypothetical protein [Holosporaceae bacterium]
MKFLSNILLASILCFAFSLRGSDEEFTIKKVSVKQSGENSVKAKEKALAKASRLSFAKILKDHFGMNKEVADSMSDQQIAECISGYSVANEKQSDSYYIAELSYKFDRKSIESMLAFRGLFDQPSVSSTKKNEKLSSDITLVTSLEDFMQNINQLKHIKYKITAFSGKVVELSLGIMDLNSIRNLRIPYVVI